MLFLIVLSQRSCRAACSWDLLQTCGSTSKDYRALACPTRPEDHGSSEDGERGPSAERDLFHGGSRTHEPQPLAIGREKGSLSSFRAWDRPGLCLIHCSQEDLLGRSMGGGIGDVLAVRRNGH